jgi:hypothetical protein
MITIVGKEYDDIAKRHFAAIPHDPAIVDAGWYENAGTLYAVMEDANRVGSIVLRTDECPAGEELVIVAGAAEPGRAPICAETLAEVAKHAAEWGYWAVRFHSARPGFERVAAGFEAVETVYRRVL